MKTSLIIIELLKNHKTSKIVSLSSGEFGYSYKNAVQIGYCNNFMLMDVIVEHNNDRFNHSRCVDYFYPQNIDGDLPDSFVNNYPYTVFAQELLNDASFSLVSAVNDRLPEGIFGVVIYPLTIRELLCGEKIPSLSIFLIVEKML